MITPKAMSKVQNAVMTGKIKSFEGVATIIAASNVLITDLNRKGELVLKHLETPNINQ